MLKKDVCVKEKTKEKQKNIESKKWLQIHKNMSHIWKD